MWVLEHASGRSRWVFPMAKEGAGLSRLELWLSVLVVLLVVATSVSAGLFVKERVRSKEVAAGEGIRELAFVRMGVVVDLDEAMDVESLTILDSTGAELRTTDVGMTAARVLAPLDWTTGTKYRFDVRLADGSVLSTPAYAPGRPVPFKLFEVSYDKEFPVEEYHATVQAHSHVEAQLSWSVDGKSLGVGALEGRASVVDVATGKERWVHYIENMSIEAVQFTDDGAYVLLGGHHPEYRFVCLDARTGEEVWHRDVKSEVGDTPTHGAPSTYLQVVGSKVWMGLSASWIEKVDATRSYMTEPRNASKVLHYRAKLYCFDVPTGDRVWTFPADGSEWDDWGGGVMDRGLMQDSLMLDEQARYLSVVLSSRDGDTRYDEAVQMVFDAQTGALKWRWRMPVVAPAYRSHITNSWLSGDGRWIAIGSHDGRGYLFDNAAIVGGAVAQPKWMRNLGLFVRIGGVESQGLITHTSDICPYTDGEVVIFHVARTQDTTSYSGNTKETILFGVKDYVAYDMDGALQWTFKIGETRAYAGTGRYAYASGGGYIGFANEHQEVSSMSQDSSSMYYAYTIHPTKTEPYFTVLDLRRGSNDGYTHLCWRVRLDGSPGSQGAISPDGWYVAFSESPVDKDPTGKDPDYHGSYKVLVYV